jgi:molybdate transport system permease protein
MVGGNLPRETRTLSISIFDAVEALDYASANATALFLLAVSFVVLLVTYSLRRRSAWTHS